MPAAANDVDTQSRASWTCQVRMRLYGSADADMDLGALGPKLLITDADDGSPGWTVPRVGPEWSDTTQTAEATCQTTPKSFPSTSTMSTRW